MEHYSKIKWLEFANELIIEEERSKMEVHLLSCEECLNSYLEILEEKELEKVHQFIPPDFPDRVMNEIDKKAKLNRTGLKSRRNIFIYYTAAACITLFLMGSGAFNLVLNTVPNTTAAIIKSPIKLEASIEKFRFDSFINNNLKISNIFKGKQ